MRPPNSSCDPSLSFFFHLDLACPIRTGRMEAQLGDLPEIKVCRAIVRAHLERAAKAALGGIEIPLRKGLETPLESCAPRHRWVRPVAQAEQFVNRHRLFKSLEPKMAGKTGCDLFACPFLGLS